MSDKREQNIFLSEYGEKFKLKLLDCVNELEHGYSEIFGSVELERVEYLLNKLYDKTTSRFNDHADCSSKG